MVIQMSIKTPQKLMTLKPNLDFQFPDSLETKL